MKVIIILLVIGHVLLEGAEILEHIWPASALIYIHPFINYTWPHDPRGINLLWWINYCCNDLLWIITFGSLAYVSRFYSKRMYQVALVFLGYHIFGHFMLWWDYRSTHLMYWFQLICDISCIFIIINTKDEQVIVRPIKRKNSL